MYIYHSGESNYEKKYIRTCPVGVKSCFGARGAYDRDDNNLRNDICKFVNEHVYLKNTANEYKNLPRISYY